MPILPDLDVCVRGAVHALNYEYVGLEFLPQGKRPLLRVYIDKVGGITVDDCEIASKDINYALGAAMLLERGYVLEVSSPGLDRPLFTLDHYRQFIGNMVNMRLKLPYEGRRNFKGLIKAVEELEVLLELDSSALIRFPLQDIQSARIIPDFS